MEPGTASRRLLGVAMMLLLVLGTGGSQLAAQSGQVVSKQSAGDVSVEVALTGAVPEVVEVERDTGRYTTFNSLDELLGEEGAPALPVVRQWVGVPSMEAPRVDVRLAEELPLPTAASPIDPMPTYTPVTDDPVADTRPDRAEASYVVDQELYAQDGWYPGNPVTVSEVVTLRGQMMREVQFTTVQVNLQSGELRWFPSAEVQLVWASDQVATQIGSAVDPHFESTFESMLANYSDARSWRLLPEINSVPDLTFELAGGNTWMIRVQGTGLFKIPLSDLAAQGVDVSAPERLALYSGDAQAIQEQAIWINNGILYFVNTQDHSRWSFNIVYRLKVLPPGELGKRMQVLNGAPVYSTTLTNVPYRTTIEKEVVYQGLDISYAPGERWHWGKMVPPNNPNFSDSFDLPAVAPGTVAITPEIGPPVGPEYNGRCNTVTFGVNGYSITNTFYGPASFEGTLQVPHTAIQPTANSVSVQSALCGATTVNAIYFGSMDVTYDRTLDAQGQDLIFNNVGTSVNYAVVGLQGGTPLVFDVSDPNNVDRLSPPTDDPTVVVDDVALSTDNDNELSGARPEQVGAEEVLGEQVDVTFGRPGSEERYLASSTTQAKSIESITFYQSQGLIGTGIQVDYVVIAPDEFKSALFPLMQHRASKGLRPRFVSTEDIYNDFGDGTADPDSIRDFLEYAYNSWPGPSLSYVLLVGDSTYDPLDYLGTGQEIIVPALLEYRDAFLGEVPSDNEYVADLDGSTDDLPDAHIGRLPAKSAADAAAMVDKILRYETNTSEGPWKRTMLFTADNRDSAGDFDCLSEWLYRPPGHYCYGAGGNIYDGKGVVPSEALVIPAYVPSESTSAQLLKVRNSIVNHVNTGALIVQYIGHGAKEQWSDGGGAWSTRRFISPGVYENDLDLLTNEDRYPFALPWTCWEGNFVDPTKEAIAEEGVRLADHGFIGSFSPVGLDVATAHDTMAVGFYERMFGKGGNQPSDDLGELTLAAKVALVGGPASFERLIYTYMLFGDPATQLQVDECLQEDGTPCSGARLTLPVIGR